MSAFEFRTTANLGVCAHSGWQTCPAKKDAFPQPLMQMHLASLEIAVTTAELQNGVCVDVTFLQLCVTCEP
eukprot:1645290-Amphidinium_carterae.1